MQLSVMIMIAGQGSVLIIFVRIENTVCLQSIWFEGKERLCVRNYDVKLVLRRFTKTVLFCGFSQSLQTLAGIVPSIEPQSLPCLSSPVHYSVPSNHSMLYSFELLIVLLNKRRKEERERKVVCW